ncbi:GNAT family N-acetyltransferase [Algoriphagus sediminis]|uniref:GNAT family N-acetyltransferase n=1 Tax=Algoriphagus sediminis TaxID=3057113 RepID=A0ABT7Y8C3_9BACT|nr:GNAT family N-acetyltransferase [Algoriphagus sediminis]MDN3202761.1 GNAT family N-acetyltransferase [Algoriphagus sediminis]
MTPAKNNYLFSTERLGFKLWENHDLEPFTAMNSDSETMKFFAGLMDKEASEKKMIQMNKMYKDHGYCYFCVNLLSTNEFVGIIGLGYKDFQTDFTPCTDIGWRIRRDFWNQGLSTEGAQACLDYGKSLGLNEIVSMASPNNHASIRVMEKIGMQYWKHFDHPELSESPHLNPMVLYRIKFP